MLGFDRSLVRGLFVLVAVLTWPGAGCGDDEAGPDAEPDGGTDAGETFTVFQEGLDGSILSIWGPDHETVFAVGGTLAADGGRALALHYDGDTWWQMEVDGPALWWVHGFGPEDIWAVGERGVIMHFDGTQWERVTGGDEDYVLYGTWGASPTELWAVGGQVQGDGRASVMLRYDGSEWAPVPEVSQPRELLFKLWGASANDVFAIGTDGALLHWDGDTWTRDKLPTDDRLVTINGRAADDIYIVGGLAASLVFHYDGSEWSQVAVDQLGGLMGVWAGRDEVLISGGRGLVMLGDEASGFSEVTTGIGQCLHASWGDNEGRLLAGGGNLVSGTAGDGVLTGRGDFSSDPARPWSERP